MKDQIKAWLKSQNHDRSWLGEQLGVGKRTVDSWLSTSSPIPLNKLKLIERLMEDDEAAEAQRRQQLEPTAQVFSVEVDLPTFRAYGKAALAQQRTLEEWAIHEINEAADAYFATKAATDTARSLSMLPAVLSEDPTEYAAKRVNTPTSALPAPGSADEKSMSDRLRDALGSPEAP